MAGKKKLLGMTLSELKKLAEELNLPSYTSKQIADWLYKKKIRQIEEMSNLSIIHRDRISKHYEIGTSSPVESMQSADGTVKYLFQTHNEQFIETVYIPDDDRSTLCVSSQVGCKMNCLFCMTGKQKFNDNLSACDILNQIQSVPESYQLTNIVFMGMGDPMDNYDELFKVLEILTSDYGYAWSPKRITVSTIGIIPTLKKFIEETKCHLAVSLHSPYHQERLKLMPIENKYPAMDVLDLIRQYDFSGQRRVSFEYIMFSGLNDSEKHAKDLIKMLRGIPCRVNLIKYHAIPEVELKSSDIQQMEIFRDILSSKGVTCTIRLSRGEDILAACGMLSTIKQNFTH